MPVSGPMTLIVLIAMAVCLGVGLLLIRRAFCRPPAMEPSISCQRCQTENPARAKFCSNCGLRLK